MADANADFAQRITLDIAGGTRPFDNTDPVSEYVKLWYQITATIDGFIHLDSQLGALDRDTNCAVYTAAVSPPASPLDLGPQVAYDDDSGQNPAVGNPNYGAFLLEFLATAGVVYYVEVDAYEPVPDGVLRWSFAPVVRPVNDNFADAIDLVGEAGCMDNISNKDGSTEPSDPVPPDGIPQLDGKTVWYKWTAPAAGIFGFRLELPGKEYTSNGIVYAYVEIFPTITAWEILPGNNFLTLVADDPEIGRYGQYYLRRGYVYPGAELEYAYSQVHFDAVAGNTYYFMLDTASNLSYYGYPAGSFRGFTNGHLTWDPLVWSGYDAPVLNSAVFAGGWQVDSIEIGPELPTSYASSLLPALEGPTYSTNNDPNTLAQVGAAHGTTYYVPKPSNTDGDPFNSYRLSIELAVKPRSNINFQSGLPYNYAAASVEANSRAYNTITYYTSTYETRSYIVRSSIRRTVLSFDVRNEIRSEIGAPRNFGNPLSYQSFDLQYGDYGHVVHADFRFQAHSGTRSEQEYWNLNNPYDDKTTVGVFPPVVPESVGSRSYQVLRVPPSQINRFEGFPDPYEAYVPYYSTSRSIGSIIDSSSWTSTAEQILYIPADPEGDNYGYETPEILSPVDVTTFVDDMVAYLVEPVAFEGTSIHDPGPGDRPPDGTGDGTHPNFGVDWRTSIGLGQTTALEFTYKPRLYRLLLPRQPRPACGIAPAGGWYNGLIAVKGGAGIGAAPLPPPCVSFIYDNFNRPDANQIGVASDAAQACDNGIWSVRVSEFGRSDAIRNNQLFQGAVSSAEPVSTVMREVPGAGDYEMSVVCYMAPGSDLGQRLLFNFDGLVYNFSSGGFGRSGYEIVFGSGGVQLLRAFPNGAFQGPYAPLAAWPGDFRTIRVQHVGAAVRVLVNDVVVLTWDGGLSNALRWCGIGPSTPTNTYDNFYGGPIL